MKNLPFKQIRKDSMLIREFSKDVNSNELVWHRDRSDRLVRVISGPGWGLQIENSLPVLMEVGKTYFIPKKTYHRLIKGKDRLVVEINESRALLRAYIRKIILESPELQAELEELIFNRESVPYTVGGGTQHREFAKQNIKRMKADADAINLKGQNWPSNKEIDSSFDLRRNVKKFWNKNADHNFWQDPKKVVAIHDLAYYAEFDEPNEASRASEDFEKDTDLKIEAFFKKYPPGKIQKDEMSAYGFLGMDDFFERKEDRRRVSLGIILDPRRVTYAARRDSHTESRSEASAADIARHAGSGLPKRPKIGKYFVSTGVLFDPEDISLFGIGELIVDNWSYDTVVINTGYNKNFSVKRVKEIIKLAKSYGLTVIDGRHGEEY